MKFTCTLETRHSEKSNKDYQVIVINFTDTYQKVVFLDKAEEELLKLALSHKNNN